MTKENDVKIILIDSYVALHGSYFMVTWTILQNHLLKVGLTQNRETVALRMLTTADLFYLIMCEDPHEWKFLEIAVGWGPRHIWLHTTLEDLWPHYMNLKVSWDGPWTLSFGLSHFHGHGSWLICEVTLMPPTHLTLGKPKNGSLKLSVHAIDII